MFPGTRIKVRAKTPYDASLQVPVLQALLQKIEDGKHTQPNPHAETKDGIHEEVIALPRLRFLHIKVKCQCKSSQEEKDGHNEGHLLIFFPVIEQPDQSNDEWDAVELGELDTRILPVSLLANEVPTHISQIHMINLILPKVIQIARILLEALNFVGLHRESSVHQRGLAVLIPLEIRYEPLEVAGIILIHRGIGIRTDERHKIGGVSQEDEQERERSDVQNPVVLLDRVPVPGR